MVFANTVNKILVLFPVGQLKLYGGCPRWFYSKVLVYKVSEREEEGETACVTNKNTINTNFHFICL